MKLPSSLSDKYELTNWTFGEKAFFPAYSRCGGHHGRVCPPEMTERYAEQLINAGFPYLKRKMKGREKVVAAKK